MMLSDYVAVDREHAKSDGSTSSQVYLPELYRYSVTGS